MAIRLNYILSRRGNEPRTGRDLLPVSLSIGLHALMIAPIIGLPRPQMHFKPEIINVELVAFTPAPSQQQAMPAEIAPAGETTPSTSVAPPPERAPIDARPAPRQVSIALPGMTGPAPEIVQPEATRKLRHPAPLPRGSRQPATSQARPDPPEAAVMPVSDWIATEYITRMREMIDAHKQYPSLSLRRNEEGTIVLRVKIASSGAVNRIIPMTQTPARLAAAATAAVRSAAPFPSLPPELGKSEASFDIPVNFRIQ
ncbi:MAG: TonB family protein [Alphaproteobacteria bacterium]